MSLITWIEARINRCSWNDIVLIKISAIALALLIAKYWPEILSLKWQWYVGIAVIAAISPLRKIFKKLD